MQSESPKLSTWSKKLFSFGPVSLTFARTCPDGHKSDGSVRKDASVKSAENLEYSDSIVANLFLYTDFKVIQSLDQSNKGYQTQC